MSDSAEDDNQANATEDIDAVKFRYESKLTALSARYEKATNGHTEVMLKLNECMLQLQEFKEMKKEWDTFRAQASGSSPARPSTHDDDTEDHNASSIQNLLNTSRLKKNVIKPPINGRDLSDPDPEMISRNRSVGSEAPVPKPRKSYIDNINIDELTRTERITLEQAHAQMEATEAQREIATSQNLTVIRKALPKITKFNGDPRKWIQFKRDVDRYRDIGKYDEYEMRIHVLQALEGLALSRVQGSIDSVPFKNTMSVLQKCFGEPTRIIDKYAKDILNLKVPKDLTKDDVLLITAKILDYFGACIYANVDVLNSNQLAMHIFSQLNLMHKQLFRHKIKQETAGSAYNVIELGSLFEFLEDLADELEEKSLDDKQSDNTKFKSYQMNLHAMGESAEDSYSKERQPDDFMFEIKNGDVSSQGYDLQELEKLSKFCDCCFVSGHYTLQCRKYKAMSVYERLRFVKERNICWNCIITATHRSHDCNLKGICGYREYKEKCTRKHHVSLHKAFNNNESNTYSYKHKDSGNDNGNSGEGKSDRTLKYSNSEINQQRTELTVNRSQSESEKDQTSDDDNAKDACEVESIPQASSSTKQTGLPVATKTASSYGSTAVCNVVNLSTLFISTDRLQCMNYHSVNESAIRKLKALISLESEMKGMTDDSVDKLVNSYALKLANLVFDPGGIYGRVIMEMQIMARIEIRAYDC